MKITLSAKILTAYGFILMSVLLSIGIVSNWGYFYSGNILLLAAMIASFPILAIALTILEVVFGKDGGFR
jgi:hypothetical protein